MRIPCLKVLVDILLLKFWLNNVVCSKETHVPALDVITGLILVILYLSLNRGLNYLKWKNLKNRAPLKRNARDIVIVYIWFPSSWTTFGHVSLEIRSHRGSKLSKNSYLSIGPREYPLSVFHYFKRNKILKMENYEEDVKDMKRKADVVLEFYTLDTAAMQTKIGILNKLIMKRRIHYGLLRRISKYQRRPTAYTCVAAVVEVFHAGCGLSKLFDITEDKLVNAKNSYDGVKNSLSRSRKSAIKLVSIVFGISKAHAFEICTTPKAFAQVLKLAKINELIMSEGVFEGDTGWLPWMDETRNFFLAVLRIVIELLTLSYLLAVSTNSEWTKQFYDKGFMG